MTEDGYIEYLAQTDVINLARSVSRKLRRSFLLFGYSIADWNLRLPPNRLRGERRSATARGRFGPLRPTRIRILRSGSS